VTRPFSGYQMVSPCDLDLDVKNVLKTRALIFYTSIVVGTKRCDLDLVFELRF
jgi:hypothetical protein